MPSTGSLMCCRGLGSYVVKRNAEAFKPRPIVLPIARHGHERDLASECRRLRARCGKRRRPARRRSCPDTDKEDS
jgi:hypothetical protein